MARQLPKAVLHDHLDGGLRVATILELADECAYEALPAQDPVRLAAAMHQDGSGSLMEYLGAFRHTVAVMQTATAIERVAYEAGVDHHDAGVVYAEVRFGPGLLVEQGLRREEAVEAALAGLRRAQDETGIAFGLIATALRDADDSVDVARAAARFAGEGVVGFDLAGPEQGFPPDDHLPAIRLARENGLGITIHAGESAGLDSIGAALGKCGAARLGHGVRIIDDCTVADGEIVAVGRLAQIVRDLRIPLEVSITSNLHTGVAPSPEAHPFGMLYRAGFNVSINTDNRLMSGIDMGAEFELAAAAHGLDAADLRDVTTRTIEAGFGDWPQRKALIASVHAATSGMHSAST